MITKFQGAESFRDKHQNLNKIGRLGEGNIFFLQTKTVRAIVLSKCRAIVEANLFLHSECRFEILFNMFLIGDVN